MKRHFDYDPLTQTTEVFHFDEATGDFAIESSIDVEPLLDINKARQNDGANGWTPSRDMKMIGSIPNIVVEKWRNEFGVNIFDKNHEPAVRRLLNDPDWRWLRTSSGYF